MKKLLTTVLAFLLLLSAAVLPAAAETFSPAGTDLTLDIDTSIWYAFTTDNLEDNHELKTLGIDAQYMQNFFQTNNAYIDALLLYSDGDGYLEFYVRKKHSDDVVNLAPCTRQELEEFAEGLRKSDSGCTSAEVWENTYNFVILERFDEPTGLYGQVYMTVVNSDLYAFTFQAPSPIDDSDRFYAKQIMESVSFDVDDPSRKFVKESSDSGIFDGVVGGAITGGAVGACSGLIGALIRRKSRKKKETAEE